MPGFLKVYGYYTPATKKWNIDVRCSLENLIRHSHRYLAHRSTAYLFIDDNRNFRLFVTRWTT